MVGVPYESWHPCRHFGPKILGRINSRASQIGKNPAWTKKCYKTSSTKTAPELKILVLVEWLMAHMKAGMHANILSTKYWGGSTLGWVNFGKTQPEPSKEHGFSTLAANKSKNSCHGRDISFSGPAWMKNTFTSALGWKSAQIWKISLINLACMAGIYCSLG